VKSRKERTQAANGGEREGEKEREEQGGPFFLANEIVRLCDQIFFREFLCWKSGMLFAFAFFSRSARETQRAREKKEGKLEQREKGRQGKAEAGSTDRRRKKGRQAGRQVREEMEAARSCMGRMQ